MKFIMNAVNITCVFSVSVAVYLYFGLPVFTQVNQYATNPVVRNLVDTYEFHILPLMNPDGSEVFIYYLCFFCRFISYIVFDFRIK